MHNTSHQKIYKPVRRKRREPKNKPDFFEGLPMRARNSGKSNPAVVGWRMRVNTVPRGGYTKNWFRGSTPNLSRKRVLRNLRKRGFKVDRTHSWPMRRQKKFRGETAGRGVRA